MKLQHLSVIFIIIMLPLILVLSTYIGLQIDTLYLQTSYDTKLNDATHDAMEAFQINTQNNDYSTVADSLKRDVEASVNTFYSSLATNMGVSGYSKEELQPYIPAVLYTMYDGYYIHSPTKTEASSEDAESLLKQYIYYSARYVNTTNHTNVVINYSLDSYISVYGIVNGEYIARSGYLIQHGSKGLTKINGEVLDKYYIKIDGKTYGNTSGIKIEDGALWNLDGSQRIIDSVIYNGQEIKAEDGVVIRGDNNEFVERKNVAGNSLSKEALYYYLEAYEFSKYISEIRLNEAINGATVYINDKDVVAENKISIPNNLFNITGTNNTDDPENIKSNLVNHKREIIRLNIENNLQNAFNNYKGTVGNSYDYQLPKFKEEEWEKIYKNVSVVTFMQGIKVGSKMYNNYSIVTSTGNEEYVDPEELYFLNNSNPVNLTYHRITDSKLITTNAGYRSLMFETRNTVNGQDAGKDILSVVLGKLYTADYATIVNGKASSVYNEETGDLLKGVKDTEGAELSDGKKQAYYTTLARERYELLKLRATSILNTSQKIKTKVLASAQSTTINSGQFSASLRPANQFSNKECTYSIINTESGEVVENNVGWCDENGKLASQSINGLDLNTTYRVNVSAVDNYGRTVTDTATFTTGDIALSPPTVQQPWLNGNPDVTITAINYMAGQELHIQRYSKDTNGELIKYGEELAVESETKTLYEADLKFDSTKTKEIVAWIKDKNTGRESSTIRENVDDETAPSIFIPDENIATTKDTIKFNIKATDYESGFNEDVKFDVKVFPEDENNIQGEGGEFSLTSYTVNEILAENITINNLELNRNYYIEVTVGDRYGNIAKYSTKGEKTIITTPEEDTKVPDAKVELIPDNPNTTEDDNVNPSGDNTNIVARYSPTYYVDGEDKEKHKQGYLGSGEKVIIKLEENLDNRSYNIEYKEYGEDTWHNYVEPIEISNNTSYLVRFIDNKGISGEPGIFNIRNIDKKEPEIRIEENKEDLSKITVIAEDSGESNSGLKVFKIEKIKFDGTNEEINPEIMGYNGTDNSGDRTNGGIAYEIQGIGTADGEEYIYKQINITAIDCVGRETIKTINLYEEMTKPVVELISVTNDNTIDKNYANKNHTIEIKFKVLDEKGNIELQDLTRDVFEVRVGGNITTLNYKEISKQDNIYTIKINGITGDGELEIKLKEGIITDKVGNGNELVNLIPNNLSNGTINNITIDNTAPVVTLSADPEDVSQKAIEANKIGQDGKNTTINAEISDISGIYTYTYKIEDICGLKEAKVFTETYTEHAKEITPYELSTTFGIYNITISNVQDRAGNISGVARTIQVYDYTIKTKEEMKIFQQYGRQIYDTVTLLSDIDLNPGFTFKEDGTYEIDSKVTNKTEPEQWNPIERLSGDLEGQGYEISGIYINRPEDSYVGLFRRIGSGQTIKNVGIINSYIRR